MTQRLDAAKTSPTLLQAMLALEHAIHKNSNLEPALIELVKIRASQINHCAYCIDMHTKDARAAGETEQRIYALSAWQEAPFFTDRERAALLWTESLTLVSQTHAPDDVYEEVRQRFTDEELVSLSMAIVTINSWNRLAVGFRKVAGGYQPPAGKHPARSVQDDDQQTVGGREVEQTV